MTAEQEIEDSKSDYQYSLQSEVEQNKPKTDEFTNAVMNYEIQTKYINEYVFSIDISMTPLGPISSIYEGYLNIDKQKQLFLIVVDGDSEAERPIIAIPHFYLSRNDAIEALKHKIWSAIEDLQHQFLSVFKYQELKSEENYQRYRMSKLIQDINSGK